MAYRYSDTLKWQDEWFVDLSAIEKLLFLYLCDNCDIAGFSELSYRKIAFDLNLKEAEIKGAVKGLGKGVFLSDDEKCLLVKNFIKHQKNLPLNPDNKAHHGIIKRVGIYIAKFKNVDLDYQEGFFSKAPLKPQERGTGNNINIPTPKSTPISLEERIKLFTKSLIPFTRHEKNPLGIYEPKTIRDFFEYWGEANASKKKMKWEMEKTWDLKLRLSRWSNSPFNQPKGKQQTLEPNEADF